MKKRVFLVQQPQKNIDLSSASNYGTIFPVYAYNDSPSLLPGPALKKAKEALAEMEDGDYLVATGGDKLGIILVTVAMLEKGITHFNWLKYDRVRKQDGGREYYHGYYVPVEIKLNKLPPKFKDHSDDAE